MLNSMRKILTDKKKICCADAGFKTGSGEPFDNVDMNQIHYTDKTSTQTST